MTTKGLSPTQRTLRELRQQGRIAAITEKWNQHVGPHGIRQDLFGFVDLLVLCPENGFVGVQCCAGSGHASHRRKIVERCTEYALAWLEAGGRIELWSWSKRKLKRDGKAMRWVPRVEVIAMGDLEPKQKDKGRIA
jgi:hypothetical protein